MDKTVFEARTLIAKLSGFHDEASESAESTGSELQPVKVFSELIIPINLPEIQTGFDVFDMLKIEPVKPALDFVIDMSVHTHVLNSLCFIEHIDIPDVHHPCTDFDFYDRLDDAADDLEIGNIIFNEQKEVYFELEIPNTLPDLPIHLNTCDLLHINSIKSLAETDVVLIDHPKFLDSVLAIEPVNMNAVIFYSTMNIDDCFDVNELLHDSIFELSLDSAADSHVSVDFDIETVKTEDVLDLELNFHFSQCSENFKCSCEADSCSICIEIDDVIQPDSNLITDLTVSLMARLQN
ncbi:hypothetical protein LR48_Vigan510s000200 [Vigna angularis]|uniref:Uncharacterized protein n=1 Tax=Phaseolus angularis TaxID=3914 RepID=A0A0L9TCC9_PHAAN|nr:uncharacterized protein HKW66_Vig0231930 [Vigna angularis]KAG2405621.1 uncharacterized protein HKW66_Vig0048760 [Vigna angularis]KOM28177.1 hypothetical protein LR48_Vigan510s000200 [Vigna angularis]